MRRLLVLIVAVGLLLPFAGLPAGARGQVHFKRSRELRAAVTKERVENHLSRFQDFADENEDTRAAGLPGYDASARYVKRRLERVGYDVTLQPFDFDFFQEVTPAEFEQTAPEEVTYVKGEDFEIMTYSGTGEVTAELVAVDLVIPPGAEANTSTSGCETDDFTGLDITGKIALMQRGTCTFRDKVDNAAAAGAVGAVILNEGQPGRDVLLAGTLAPPLAAIPAIGTTFALGEELANGVVEGPTGITVRLKTDTFSEVRSTNNVIAETESGNPNNVVVAGAHLDSVPEGPGINDNGSGSAGLLEVAIQMARLDIEPTNMVRFVWWSAEESGLIGSNFYVENLSEEELADIGLYLNFDMIGSPNFMRGVYDGNGSAFPDVGGGPEGSGQIERIFQRYFQNKELPTVATEFNGRSDYQAFILSGIPAGGLFTGAEVHKTEHEAALFGGQPNEAFDPCYHQDCDDIENVNLRITHQNSDAIAHSVLTLAMSTKFVSPEAERMARRGVRVRPAMGERVK